MNPSTPDPQNQPSAVPPTLPVQPVIAAVPAPTGNQIQTRWFPTPDDPGHILIYVGLAISILITPIIGFILLLVARKKSLQAGFRNKIVSLFIILDIVVFALTIVAIIITAIIVIVSLNAGIGLNQNIYGQTISQ